MSVFEIGADIEASLCSGDERHAKGLGQHGWKRVVGKAGKADRLSEPAEIANDVVGPKPGKIETYVLPVH
jgi:hypothetical protein